MFPTNSERLSGISDAFSAFTVPPTKARLLCATPAGLDLYVQAMPVGTYRVQSPGFPKIVYYRKVCDFGQYLEHREDQRIWKGRRAVLQSYLRSVEACCEWSTSLRH